MNSNKFRKLRFLKCDSPAQTGQPVCASVMPRLRAQPPPQTHPEVIMTMREVARQNRIIMREKSPISSRPQSVALPPIFGSSQARGLCPHPPAQRKTPTLAKYGIRADQRKAELSRQIRHECYSVNSSEGHDIPQKESAISESELKANLKPCLKVPNAPEAKKAARDAIRTQMKTEERKALESDRLQKQEKMRQLNIIGKNQMLSKVIKKEEPVETIDQGKKLMPPKKVIKKEEPVETMSKLYADIHRLLDQSAILDPLIYGNTRLQFPRHRRKLRPPTYVSSDFLDHNQAQESVRR